MSHDDLTTTSDTEPASATRSAYPRRSFLGSLGLLGGAAVVLGPSVAHAASKQFGFARQLPANAPGNDEITIGVFYEPDSLDPATMRLTSSFYVAASVFDPLIWKIQGVDGYVPGLATEWEVSEDASAYTFKIREGVTFHDGTPLDAAAVKASFDRIVDPATNSIKTKASLGAYKGAEVVDDLTVTISFEGANATFLDTLTGPLMGIVSPLAAANAEPPLARFPVGTGPFKFESWKAGESVTLVRNDDYNWGPGAGGNTGAALPSKIGWRIVTSSPAQANALQTGALHIAQGMTTPDLSRVASEGFEQVVITSSGGPFGFMLNTAKFPTDDVLVRQAIQYATNAEEIREVAIDDVYDPATTVTTAATFGHDPEVRYSLDIEKANALLDEAGWALEDDGVRRKDGEELFLEWLLFSGNGWERPAEMLAAQLEPLGFRSNITAEVAASALEKSQQGVMNVSGYSYADPSPFFLNNLFTCDQRGASNFSHVCDPDVDTAIAAANQIVDADERAAAFQEVQRMLMELAVFVPICEYAVGYATAPEIAGLEFTSIAVPILTNVTLSGE